MFKKKQGIHQTGMYSVMITIGIILLLAAGLITGYGYADDYYAGKRAEAVLEQIREEVPVSVPETLQPEQPAASAEPVVFVDPDISVEPELIPIPLELPKETDPPALQYDAIGVLSIPKLTLELPVLSECSSSRLKVSVCRYEGEVLGKPEKLVVAGHNYKSHFGRLPNLSAGDEVLFNTLDGIVYNYIVVEIVNISMYDREALEKGEWDLSLFTCDTNRSRRILIKCQENG